MLNGSITRTATQFFLNTIPIEQKMFQNRFSTTNASSLALRADEALFIIQSKSLSKAIAIKPHKYLFINIAFDNILVIIFVIFK